MPTFSTSMNYTFKDNNSWDFLFFFCYKEVNDQTLYHIILDIFFKLFKKISWQKSFMLMILHLTYTAVLRDLDVLFWYSFPLLNIYYNVIEYKIPLGSAFGNSLFHGTLFLCGRESKQFLAFKFIIQFKSSWEGDPSMPIKKK